VVNLHGLLGCEKLPVNTVLVPNYVQKYDQNIVNDDVVVQSIVETEFCSGRNRFTNKQFFDKVYPMLSEYVNNCIKQIPVALINGKLKHSNIMQQKTFEGLLVSEIIDVSYLDESIVFVTVIGKERDVEAQLLMQQPVKS
jgi:hypothetical protein